MLSTENGNVVIKCSRCPVRMALGPKPLVERRNRMPSMWRNLGNDHHLCPSCAAVHAPRFTRTPAREPIFA